MDPLSTNKIRILMVTGVYYPEVNGAAGQCRELIRALNENISFQVLTSTHDQTLIRQNRIDDIPVFRSRVRSKNIVDYLKAFLNFTTIFLSQRGDFQIVHFHGFSYKSTWLTLLCKLFHKKIIIKMTSFNHDDTSGIRDRGFLISYFFYKADAYVGVSPVFEKPYLSSSLSPTRLKLIPNGVDTNRFCPVTDDDKQALRSQLGFPGKMKLILFVGHFSREKSPDLLVESWKQYVVEEFPDTGIIFIGSTNPDHYEVDAELVKYIQRMVAPYNNEQIFFVDRTNDIEKYYQTADLFVLPSSREGMPNALLEAMACSLPVIVSRLEGVTDWVINDGLNGLLFQLGVNNVLGKLIKRILNDSILAQSLGREARRTVQEKFSMNRVAGEYAKLYKDLVRSA